MALALAEAGTDVILVQAPQFLLPITLTKMNMLKSAVARLQKNLYKSTNRRHRTRVHHRQRRSINTTLLVFDDPL